MACAFSNFHCEICDLDFTSVMSFIEHQESSNHQLRTHLKNANTSSKHPLSKLNEMFECHSENVYKCHVCDIFVTGIIPFKQHVDGSKHQKKFRNKQAMGTFKNMLVVSDMISGLEDLNLSDTVDEVKTITSFELKGDELELSKNIDDRDFSRFVINETKCGSFVNSPTSKADTLAFPLVCEPCGKRFTGEEPYRQHMESVLHLRKVQQVTTNVKQLESFMCKDCLCNFSGPIPYKQHLESPKHAKQVMANKVLLRVVREGNSGCTAAAPDVSSLFKQADDVAFWEKCARANLDSTIPSHSDDIKRIGADEPVKLN